MQNLIKRITYLIITFSLVFTCNLKAQTQASCNDIQLQVTVPAITILDIEPNTGTFVLAFTAPTLGGDPIGNPSNDSKWLNYSVLKASTSPLLSIYARITSGTAPAGTALYLQASAISGSSSGVTGTALGQITLTSSNQKIVQSIGSCSTGDGILNGHQLTFSAAVTNYSALRFTEGSAPSIVVQFTIMN